ncbi:MAG TPA: aminotransferase [Ruminococcaceae bacterium]|nr:aminotransferase [Oscillospiraceae bacterium]
MSLYSGLSQDQLQMQYDEVKQQYDEFKARNLHLNMSRGKPSTAQLDMSLDIFDSVNALNGYKAKDGTDCRNYGNLTGLEECKTIFSQALGVQNDNIIVCGNSSLNIMFDYVAQCMTHGAGSTPWMLQGKIKFICPVPGYDRHFGICEYFNIEMVNVPMLESGPDMDKVEELIQDSSVKGMFCVPKYSNPIGITFSDETVRRIASMKPAADDFRVIWDNAYFVHDIADEGDTLLNIFPEAEKNGNEDMIIEVASTSKISFPGAGIAVLAASENNIKMIAERMSRQIIGYDKINQLRHARVLRDGNGLREYMKRHASILKPKFEIVVKTLDRDLTGLGIAEWTHPRGGYFVSLDVMHGCAKRVVELCREAGVTLTGAGATYPYGKDPNDSNIRIAPSYPSLDELREAMNLITIAVKLAALEKLMDDND